MQEKAARFRPTRYREGKLYAQKKLKEASEGVKPPSCAVLPVPIRMFDYIFRLQVQTERQGAMDYHKYANTMWDELARGEKGEGFKQFEGSMIIGLDMSAFVYPDLLGNMPKLIDKYKDEVNSVALWSTGDVDATGYQISKVVRSRIVGEFLKTLRERFPDSGQDFAESKTAYMVDDDKYERAVEYAREKLDENSGQPIKFVIIDDNVGTFDKTKRLLDEKLGPDKVKIVPIWFTASREGTNAQRAVDGLRGTDEYEEANRKFKEQKNNLNAIASFDELLDDKRFASMFKDSHVLVDFDGVICDNIKMRDIQARVIFNSLINGIHLQTGEDPEIISARLVSNLPK